MSKISKTKKEQQIAALKRNMNAANKWAIIQKIKAIEKSISKQNYNNFLAR